MDRYVALLKALADESRLSIVWILEDRELCVCEIQEVLGLAQSTVSRHLQVLEDAGFVIAERAGLWKNYRLHPTPSALAQGLLAQARAVAIHAPEALDLRERASTVCREDLCAARSAA